MGASRLQRLFLAQNAVRGISGNPYPALHLPDVDDGGEDGSLQEAAAGGGVSPALDPNEEVDALAAGVKFDQVHWRNLLLLYGVNQFCLQQERSQIRNSIKKLARLPDGEAAPPPLLFRSSAFQGPCCLQAVLWRILLMDIWHLH